MVKYLGLNAATGVSEYEIGTDWIKVRFKHNKLVYVYGASKPGRAKVLEMKRLAVEGKGLATYINQNVRQDFERTE